VGPDGTIYAIGGEGAGILNTVEAYNPVTNSWSTKAAMPTARTALAASAGTDGTIYAIGGVNSAQQPVNTVEAYNPATNSWSTEAAMPTARAALAAITGPDGIIYALGGNVHTPPNTNNDTNIAESYDPTTNSWSEIAPLPTSRGSLAAAV
jgi:N-acetylneuraminic acid mutarotase